MAKARAEKKYFFLDLDKPDKSLEIYEYHPDDLREDLDYFKKRSPMDLSDYDWHVFDSEAKADKFLKAYKKVKAALNNDRICKSRDLPAILYKRRYMVLSLMGLKAQTYRGYEKNWKPGQLFNLHDQTYFLTVKLTSLTYSKEHKAYCYKFTLPR